jgi:hypothetical protein
VDPWCRICSGNKDLEKAEDGVYYMLRGIAEDLEVVIETYENMLAVGTPTNILDPYQCRSEPSTQLF